MRETQYAFKSTVLNRKDDVSLLRRVTAAAAHRQAFTVAGYYGTGPALARAPVVARTAVAHWGTRLTTGQMLLGEGNGLDGVN